MEENDIGMVNRGILVNIKRKFNVIRRRIFVINNEIK